VSDVDEESSLPETAVDRRTRVSLAASIVVHVLAALLFALLYPFFSALAPVPPKPAEVVTERIEFEKKKPPPPPRQPRTVYRPAPAPRVVAPQPVVTARPIVRALPHPHELARIAPHAPLTLPQTHVARPALPPPASIVRGKPHLSEQQIAQIQGDLGDSIRQDRAGIDPLRVPPTEATPSMKHYGHDYSSFALGTGSHGLCDPVRDWKDGNWDYYYVACNVQADDGTFDREGVPWPVRFPADDDPFAGTSKAGNREVPLAMPLPGWHLGPGETVSQHLRDYAHEHGVDL
jgi:hypothetical protein